MKRRNFLTLTTISVAVISVPFLYCRNSSADLEKTLTIPQTLSQITDENSIKVIGKEYGKLYPDEYTRNLLEQNLTNNGVQSVSAGSQAKDIYSFLDNNILEDFKSGNSMVLNGWVLSRTEARQCALLSLY